MRQITQIAQILGETLKSAIKIRLALNFLMRLGRFAGGGRAGRSGRRAKHQREVGLMRLLYTNHVHELL